MIRRSPAFLAACFALSLLFFWLARSIPEEARKREILCRESEEAQAFLQRHSREIEAARRRLSQWEERTSGVAETRLVDAVSRFQRRRDDFRLVGLIQAPEGILLEAECRSQAAVDFLFFCDRDLLDLAPARITLSCPSGTRVGSLRTEIAFRRLLRPAVASAVSTPSSPEAVSPLTMLKPLAADLEVRH